MPHGTVEAITATRASVRLLTPSLVRFWITISFNAYVGSVCGKRPKSGKRPTRRSTLFLALNTAVCTANFTGTSQAMEGAIAIKLWKRSIERNQLVYSTYIGDGDSSSYKRLVESNPYGDLESVRKEECLGHVQKRLEKHLKKSSQTAPAVTKSKVERVGHLYALVVCCNTGKSAAEIQQALYTLIGHLGEQHSNCPSERDSWC